MAWRRNVYSWRVVTRQKTPPPKPITGGRWRNWETQHSHTHNLRCRTLTSKTLVPTIHYTLSRHYYYKYRPSEAVDFHQKPALFCVHGKAHPRTSREGPEGEIYSSVLPSTSTLDEGAWSPQRPGRCTPAIEPVHIVWEDGWAPGPV